MVKEILLSPWAIGGLLGIVLTVLARFVDEDKAYTTGKAHGQVLSRKMRGTKMGAKAWEKIEAFGQRVGGAYFHGVMDGLDGDDAEPVQETENADNQPKEEKPNA